MFARIRKWFAPKRDPQALLLFALFGAIKDLDRVVREMDAKVTHLQNAIMAAQLSGKQVH